ncbi:hypothetical protein GGD81_002041 [Rhodobium orientis]|nr:hypothetical protein [Rhodobium orientis]
MRKGGLRRREVDAGAGVQMLSAKALEPTAGGERFETLLQSLAGLTDPTHMR